MYEFFIENIYTAEEKIVYGYNIKNALERAKLPATEWGVVYMEYVD